MIISSTIYFNFLVFFAHQWIKVHRFHSRRLFDPAAPLCPGAAGIPDVRAGQRLFGLQAVVASAADGVAATDRLGLPALHGGGDWPGPAVRLEAAEAARAQGPRIAR